MYQNNILTTKFLHYFLLIHISLNCFLTERIQESSHLYVQNYTKIENLF